MRMGIVLKYFILSVIFSSNSSQNTRTVANPCPLFFVRLWYYFAATFHISGYFFTSQINSSVSSNFDSVIYDCDKSPDVCSDQQTTLYWETAVACAVPQRRRRCVCVCVCARARVCVRAQCPIWLIVSHTVFTAEEYHNRTKERGA